MCKLMLVFTIHHVALQDYPDVVQAYLDLMAKVSSSVQIPGSL